MNISSPAAILAAHLIVLSAMSFGGFPTVLPNVHELAAAKGWLTDREFADIFAVSQVMPGPNMILMMSFIGLKLGGVSGAIASALATFGPPCAMYYLSYTLWDRFREMPWQRIVRRALAPLTVGLVVAGGYVMARAGDADWASAAITAGAVALTLRTRLSPLWILMAGGALGGLNLL
jgi:chromate transporter